MSYTSGNSSKASKTEVKTNTSKKEVLTKDVVEMGLIVNVAIPRVDEKDRLDNSKSGLIVKSGEYRECGSDFEQFSIGEIKDCVITKNSDNKIVEVNTEKSRFVLGKDGKYVREAKAKTSKNEER